MKKLIIALFLLMLSSPVWAAPDADHDADRGPAAFPIITPASDDYWILTDTSNSGLFSKVATSNVRAALGLGTASSVLFADVTGSGSGGLKAGTENSVRGAITLYSNVNPYAVGINSAATPTGTWTLTLQPGAPGGANYLFNVDADGTGGWTDPSTFQTADADLTTWAGVTPSSNGQSLVAAANYAAMRTLLDVEPGVDYDAATPSTLNLTTDTSVTEAQLLTNKFISNQGASGEVDITLPAVSYSITRTVLITEAQIAEINPPSGEAFDLSGTTLTADYCIDSPATVGSKAVFTRMQNASGTWHWSVDVVRGTWADTGVTD